MSVTRTLRPLIAGTYQILRKDKTFLSREHTLSAVPTTAGTGSETTGTAVVDVTSMSFKTGISSRALKPVLGVVDTLNTRTCSRELHVSTGLDVLFHSLESYTAIP